MPVNINFWLDEPVLAFLVVFMPVLLLWGMKSLSDWMVNFIKIRQGYFSVNWIMKNHQWREKMIKPTGNEVKVEGKPQPFINSPEYTAFRGNKKMLFFSRIGERLKQMQIKGLDEKDFEKKKGIPPENEFNEMLDAAFSAGTIFGLKKSTLEKILLYITVVIAAGALLMGVINMGILNTLDGKLNTTQSSLTTISDFIKNNVSTSLIPRNATVLGG